MMTDVIVNVVEPPQPEITVHERDATITVVDQDTEVSVNIAEERVVNIITPSATQVVRIVALGPRGPAGTQDITLPAAGWVNAHRVVSYFEGGIVHAQLTVPHVETVIGISLQAGDGSLLVRTSGLVQNDGWNFVSGEPVYLDDNGHLTQSPSGDPTTLRIGFASGTNEIYLAPQQPVYAPQ